MKNKFVCIHGHFYQPPRENPWIEEVETEDSARPYHDWNERIFHECYGPNAASPILDEQGRIRELVNNYASISFNFGPTLLSWMERHHPDMYNRILHADSDGRNGASGNALAQAYNHMILPLASRRDLRTQVRWGIEDFKSRFHRMPEGLWLPETAVDDQTLETLIAEGIRFTILSPLQVSRTRPIRGGENEWRDASGVLDTTQAYRWFSKESPERFVDIVFYNRSVSQAVAFEGLLHSGDRFARRVSAEFNPDESPELVLVATDGESYGHHHRFGNMALSYALKELKAREGIRVVNLSEFLSLYPPRREVEILPSTAWSCAHGVGRWSADCGCRISRDPRLHQRWRAPLRAALDSLARRLDDFYEQDSRNLLRNPWEARDGYIQRVLQRDALSDQRFLDRHAARHLTAAEAAAALRLCEMQRQRLLMFTSCGWFFDDIAGLEATQILKYAARAAELAAASGLDELESIQSKLLSDLRLAPSNDPHLPDGSAVYSRLVSPLRVDLSRAAAHFIIERHLRGADSALESHAFDVRCEPQALEERHGVREERLSVSRIRLRRRATLEEFAASFAVHDRGRTDIECRSLPDSDPEGCKNLAARLARAFHEQDAEMFRETFRSSLSPEHYTLDALFTDARRRALSMRILQVHPAQRKITDAWLAEVAPLRENPDADPARALHRLSEAVRAGIPPDSLPEVGLLRARIARAFRRLLHENSTETLQEAAELLKDTWDTGLHLNIWEIQCLYGLWREKHAGNEPDAEAGECQAAIDRLLKFAPKEKEREVSQIP